MAVEVSGQTLVTDESLVGFSDMLYEIRITWRGLTYDYAEISRNITVSAPLMLLGIDGDDLSIDGEPIGIS